MAKFTRALEWENKKYIEIEPLRQFSKLNQGTSAFWVVAEWVGVLGMIALCEYYREEVWWPALYALSILWIGARQHGMMVLGHDGLHWLLFKNKKLNDWVSDLLLFWPVLNTVRVFRATHDYHHKYLATEKDPELYSKDLTHEYELPKKGLRFLGIFILDILGITALREYVFRWFMKKRKEEDVLEKFPYTPKQMLPYNLFRLVYYAGILGVFIWFDIWHILLLYWVVPFFSWLQVILRWRKIADHTLVPDGALIKTGIVIPTWFDRLFILPHNFSYHVEHHLYPSVPCYRLPRLHKHLMKNPEFSAQAHVTKGFYRIVLGCFG